MNRIDNSFDSIINNTPSVSELEEKAKNGEPINLSDLCKAVKNEQKNPPEKPKSECKPKENGMEI